MARRMFNRRFRRPVARAKQHWAAVSAQSDPFISGIVEEVPMIVTADYASNTALSPNGVTHVRTVGEVLWYPTTLNDTTGSPWKIICTAGIAVVDTDEDTSSGFSPGSQQALIDERWLWVDSVGYQQIVFNATGIAMMPMMKMTFDIRTKVRLRDSGLSMFGVMQKLEGDNDPNPTVNFSVRARTLLRGEMT